MNDIIQQVSWCDGVFNYTAFRTNSIIELHKVQIEPDLQRIQFAISEHGEHLFDEFT